jgi:hypothetical protein
MSLKFKLMHAYYGCKFFVLKVWTYIYWKHLWGCLYICGLGPALTDEYVESRKARLRETIDEMQYNRDPQVMEAVAQARAALQSLDEGYL